MNTESNLKPPHTIMEQPSQQESQLQMLARSQILIQGIKPLKMEPEDDPEASLLAFEHAAEESSWPRKQWALRLVPMLSGEAQNVYQAFPSVTSEDSNQVKDDIHDHLSVREESYRKRFRSLTFTEGARPRTVAHHLQEWCKRWLKPEIRSSAEIVELIIVEQFIQILPTGAGEWLAQHQVSSLDSTVQVIEDYLAREDFRPALRDGSSDVMASASVGTRVTEGSVTVNPLHVPGIEEKELLMVSCHGSSPVGFVKVKSETVPRSEDWEDPHVMGCQDSEERRETSKHAGMLSVWAHQDSEITEGLEGSSAACATVKPELVPGIEDTEESADLDPLGSVDSERLKSSSIFPVRPEIVPKIEGWKGLTVRDFQDLEGRHEISSTETATVKLEISPEGGEWDRPSVRDFHATEGRETIEVTEEPSFRCSKDLEARERMKCTSAEMRIRTSHEARNHEEFSIVLEPNDEDVSSCSNKLKTCKRWHKSRSKSSTAAQKQPTPSTEGKKGGFSQLVNHTEQPSVYREEMTNMCTNNWTTKNSFPNINRTHTEEILGKWCESGSMGYGVSETLTRNKGMQSGEKQYTCTECGKCFSRSSNLCHHRQTHKGEKRYACTDCGKGFRCNSHLSAHKRTHTKEKPYVCTECGKCFSVNTNLTAHKRIHTGEKPYACSECGKHFTQGSSLIAHRKMHTGEKSFQCTECGKSYRSKSNLKEHQKIHTEAKTYVCVECGKCFLRSSELTVHQRTHTQEKPYPCTECGKCFSQRANLLTHKKKVHEKEKIKMEEKRRGDGKTRAHQ